MSFKCKLITLQIQLKVKKLLDYFESPPLHRLEQYLTLSQSFSHFFRHVNGRPQVTQFFCGRLDFLIIFMLIFGYQPSAVGCPLFAVR
jgi:hypothetical protein